MSNVRRSSRAVRSPVGSALTISSATARSPASASGVARASGSNSGGCENTTAGYRAEAGRDVEAQVLARAVTWHAEHRVVLNGDRTVVLG
jgi:hypothetical protein